MTPRDAEVRALYDSTLKPRLEALDGTRRELKRYILKAALLVGVPFVLGIAGAFVDTWIPGSAYLAGPIAIVLTIVAVIVAGLRYLMPGFTAFTNYKARFKREVVAEIFKIVVPTAEYEPFKAIAQRVFDEPGIFNTRGSYWSDDRVRGRIGQTPFEAAEVKRQYSTGSGKNRTTHVVFQGLFFHLDFNKSVRGTTIVEPEGVRRSQIGDRSGVHLVALENPDFEREFKVYATDAVEARYILTPRMMEQLLALRQRMGHPVFLGFAHNSAYIGVHYERPLFEPSIASTTSLEAIEEIASQFALAEAVVHELDLNTRIGTKDIDDSLLKQEDEVSHPLLEDAFTTGNLTEGDLWKLATAESGVTVDDEALSAPRPAGSSIEVQHDGSGARIVYALSFSFFVALAVSLACLVVFLVALRDFSAMSDLEPLTRLLAWLPAIPSVDAVVHNNAIVWLPASFVVGSFFSLWWITRVRHVVVTADAVRILRGLRPFARRYPRPLYGRVVRLDKAVYVGKVGGTGLLNPSASPILQSGDEAKWVAAELRRALRQTERG